MVSFVKVIWSVNAAFAVIMLMLSMTALAGRVQNSACQKMRITPSMNFMMREFAMLDVEKITPAIGGIVKGVDFSKQLDARVQGLIYEALLEHQVIFFRASRSPRHIWHLPEVLATSMSRILFIRMLSISKISSNSKIMRTHPRYKQLAH